MITILDYGVGNLGSIHNMLRRIGIEAEISGDPQQLASAEKIILPGVGAFDHAMQRLNDSGLREALDKKVADGKTPLLGICLGMQMLTNGSEEGKLAGLGYIDAQARKFPARSNLKVPHMGWNVAMPSRPSPLTKKFDTEMRFYFVHSFFVKVENQEDSMLKCNYGIEFDAGIQDCNIYGVQFHPEKSHRFGMTLLSNFGAL